MGRVCRAGVLASLLVGIPFASIASASPLTLDDPIVRTRGGGGSIQIFELPFEFNFGVFPSDPDGVGTDCSVGFDTPDNPTLTKVSCDFQNLTGSTISELHFIFGSPVLLELTLEDTSGFFSNTPGGPFFALTANFQGTGVPSGSCPPIEGPCTGGEFGIDLVGFPPGTTAFVTSASPASPVPEPASLLLLGSGLALGAAFISRRQRKSTGRHTSGHGQ